VRVSNVKAESNPRGGQIDLSWTNPARSVFPDFTGVKVLRREATFPDPQDFRKEGGIYNETHTGFGDTIQFSDTGLKHETVYYYGVAAYDGKTPANYYPVFVSALSTTGYDTASQLYDALPAVYQRYDTVLPPPVPRLDPQDAGKGQLRRLVEMYGQQFDLLRSYASAMRDFADVERVDGALLPLLAQWLGWQTDFSLPFVKQRNEIRYAPHFYRTTGIAANLRATLNRLTTWDAQIKEFVHSIFVTNHPEQLTIWESTRRQERWNAPQPVTPDVAYEGRPAAVRENDKQQWLFYHARLTAQSPAGVATSTASTEDFYHLWYKLCDYGRWLPAQRITLDNRVAKYPSAVQRRSDGNFLVFYSDFRKTDAGLVPRLRHNLLAAGRPAQPARIEGIRSEPFALVEGASFEIGVSDSAAAFTKTVIFHREDFRDIAQASATEVVAVLNRELPRVEVTRGVDGSIIITSLLTGAKVSLRATGAVATVLGLTATGGGSDSTAAQLTGSLGEDFSLSNGDTLALKVDGKLSRIVTFELQPFSDITKAKAAEVVAAINSFVPGLAHEDEGKIRLLSPTTGEKSSIVLDIDGSTAAPRLGFGVPVPPAEPLAADSEPAAFEDEEGRIWLFWSSRRTGRWNIWYSQFDGAQWSEARQLTAGKVAEREPAVLFDSSPGGMIWVFWSGRKENGRWNIFYRTTPNKDFATLREADWNERELELDDQLEYDNQEPAAFLVNEDHAELYFSSNRADGHNIWRNLVSPTGAERDQQITTGQFTHRAPAVLSGDSQLVRLWFRSNESRVYNSRLYPAARTVDSRYSGSTTIDTRNPAKFSIRGSIKDVMHYTYDTKRENDNWYARDTVGIYLFPDTNDEALIIRKRDQIESLLRSFLPIQVRAVIIIQQVFPEIIYTYDYPDAAEHTLIHEQMIDTILGEVYKGVGEAYGDRVNFHWFRLWDRAHQDDTMPDLATPEPKLSARLFLKDVEEGD
jgi:phage tail-like protein